MEKLLMTSQSTRKWNLGNRECLYGQCDQECQYGQRDQEFQHGQCDRECQYGQCDQECQNTQVWPRMARTTEQTMWNPMNVPKEKLCYKKKILFNCFIEFERWIFQKFDFYYYFYWTDRINMSDSLGRRGSMLYSIHFMVYIGVKYHKVSSQVLSTWHIMCQWY